MTTFSLAPIAGSAQVAVLKNGKQVAVGFTRAGAETIKRNYEFQAAKAKHPRAKVSFDAEMAVWQVAQGSQVLHRTIDRADAREYALCL